MMLAFKKLRVALVTTHLPLRAVADSINTSLIIEVITEIKPNFKTGFRNSMSSY